MKRLIIFSADLYFVLKQSTYFLTFMPRFENQYTCIFFLKKITEERILKIQLHANLSICQKWGDLEVRIQQNTHLQSSLKLQQLSKESIFKLVMFF